MAISITRDKLSPEEQKKFDVAWQQNAFNGYANDMMSLHRSLQDTRDAECVYILRATLFLHAVVLDQQITE